MDTFWVIHPRRGILLDKNAHENSSKVATRIHPFSPRKFAFYVHRNSATLPIVEDKYFCKTFGMKGSQIMMLPTNMTLTATSKGQLTKHSLTVSK
jgi:hypothetical protein